MRINVVFGAPCSGKTRYVSKHVGDHDMIYDYDALLYALTNRTEHITEKHAAHVPIVQLRRVLVDLANDQSRPDKEAWKTVIEDWFLQYGKYPERWTESEVRIIKCE